MAVMAVPSVSRNEQALADQIEAELSGMSHLELQRCGNALVARTNLGRPTRVVVAGHIDTVPENNNAVPVLDGEVLHGLGSVDMKSGVAVMVELAMAATDPIMDVTWIFYDCEEIGSEFNGLARLFREYPPLVQGDAALLLEPTGGHIEAGCQGSLEAELRLTGRRAHTARPWMGCNAIHRLARVLDLLDSWPGRRVVMNDCEFREALQAVAVSGGVAGNVVPDRAVLTINHRFAPDRTPHEAEASLRALLGPVLDPGDELVVVDASPSAPPSLHSPVLARLCALVPTPPRSKLGWTDVARFAEHGIPAANFGPGDPTLCHAPNEQLQVDELSIVATALGKLLGVDELTSEVP